MKTTKIILPITPQTNVRTTQGTAILFRIPEECPHNCGLPRRTEKSEVIKVEDVRNYPELWEALGKENWKPRKKTKEIRYGCPHMLNQTNLLRKRRVEKYNRYKRSLAELAEQVIFSVPNYGWSLYFYFPVPKWWSKIKKQRMHGQIHMQQPDRDNCEKAFLDALCKKDEKVGQISGNGKFWVNQEVGYIEILLNQPVYNPFNVILQQ